MELIIYIITHTLLVGCVLGMAYIIVLPTENESDKWDTFWGNAEKTVDLSSSLSIMAIFI